MSSSLQTAPPTAIRFIKYLLFSASILPSIVAGALAYANARFELLPWAVAALGLLIGQAGGDYLYFYFTHFHTDQRDAHTKIFAGWQPLFTGTLLKPEHSLYAGFACLAVDLVIGVYFFVQMGVVILLLALAGGAVAVFFTPLMLRGLKEPVIFVTFGPLCMLGVYYVQTRMLSLEVLLASLPVAFLVTLVAYFKSARFEVSERDGDKVVLKISNAVIRWLLMLAYVSLAVVVIAGQLTPWTLLGLLSTPAAVWLGRKMSSRSTVSDYLWATVIALLIFITTGFLVAMGIIISSY
jgi:1,4-dihydroxy-2-naphthoate octaprenyltransferase